MDCSVYSRSSQDPFLFLRIIEVLKEAFICVGFTSWCLTELEETKADKAKTLILAPLFSMDKALSLKYSFPWKKKPKKIKPMLRILF